MNLAYVEDVLNMPGKIKLGMFRGRTGCTKFKYFMG